MKKILPIFTLIIAATFSAAAQAPASVDPLLGHMTGNWVLQGVIAGSQTTHDIESDWVLNHEYIRLQETSREKNAQGNPAYEAIVFIGWDKSSGDYTCLWLDSTEGGGINAQAIAHGTRSGDQIAFLFNFNGIFHTTFVYNKSADTWQWIMDNDDKGKLLPFARVKLTRK
jgi:hypothetical protein